MTRRTVPSPMVALFAICASIGVAVGLVGGGCGGDDSAPTPSTPSTPWTATTSANAGTGGGTGCTAQLFCGSLLDPFTGKTTPAVMIQNRACYVFVQQRCAADGCCRDAKCYPASADECNNKPAVTPGTGGGTGTASGS